MVMVIGIGKYYGNDGNGTGNVIITKQPSCNYNVLTVPVGGIELSFIMCKEKEMKRRSKAIIGIAAGSLIVFFDLLSIAPLNE